MAIDEEPLLVGFTIGITADRRGEDQAVMFRRLGAQVVQGPAMMTVFGSDDPTLQARTEQLVAHAPDFLVANTGIGIRTWMAKAAEWDLAEDLAAALRGARIAARGPKAAGALSSAGLPMWWRAPGETLVEVTDHLVGAGVSGATVAFQVHGDDGSPHVERLERAGAAVVPVAPYRWSLPERASGALGLIERCCSGEIDAITFTAGPQIHNLIELAETQGRAEALVAALNGEMIVGCIGPVCAAAAVEEGIADVLVPDHWRLGSLVKAVAAELGARANARGEGATAP